MSTVASRELPAQFSERVLAGLLALRILIGWHLFYEGISKLLAANWSSAGYLSTSEGIFEGVFRAIAANPALVETVDVINTWALTLIGLLLMLGLFTRITAIAGGALLLLYSLSHPALPGMAGASGGGGSYLFVDRNMVEAMAMITIALAPPGLLWGLDRLLIRRRVQDEDTVESTGRRELIRDLAGVPVLGALAASVLGVRAAADETQVDAVSGATAPALRRSPVLEGRRGNIVSVRDFEAMAPNYMTPANWAYVSGGSGDEQTLRWNEAAYRRIHLRLRVINAQTQPDTRIRMFGREMAHPIMLAPARQADLHPEGEGATVRGAAKAKATTIVSSMAGMSIESIAEAASEPVWYQAYLFKDRDRAQGNIEKAEKSGYGAICVTLDSSSNGPRDRQYRHVRQRDPERFQRHHGNPWTWPTTWDDFAWYRSLTKLPVLPKGIMTADDAERALDLGADGIYISNHGGRVFDGGIATVQVLPAIAQRVAGRAPIIIDGGIRRGTAVLQALALGATAVAVGRPFLYGLAVNGADGVAAVINMLWNELEMAMISTGQHGIANLDRSGILAMEETAEGARFFSS